MFNNILRNNYFVIRNLSNVARPIRYRKPKADGNSIQSFVDEKRLKVVGGTGGDGCISFLRLWSNEFAGPDGGDGGNGGHVIFQASMNTKNLNNVPKVAKALNGGKGTNRDCCGKNADHYIINVPVGTVIKSSNGKVVGELCKNGMMFIAAKGGAGGKGNHFFITDVEQAPEIGEYGGAGEELEYQIELKSMAHVGLIGFPNAGKSTLLRAISRARPKVAPYPFTTLKPLVGMVEFCDYEQIAVADLPGLIEDSHKNKGLGIQFLKHIERCSVLVFVLDASLPEPWSYFETLQFEMGKFNESLKNKPYLVVANKIDIPEARENLKLIQEKIPLDVIPISAKTQQNVYDLLIKIREMYDKAKEKESS